jgi:hypothetical protein
LLVERIEASLVVRPKDAPPRRLVNARQPGKVGHAFGMDGVIMGLFHSMANIMQVYREPGEKTRQCYSPINGKVDPGGHVTPKQIEDGRVKRLPVNRE